jgi:hypothetical protein
VKSRDRLLITFSPKPSEVPAAAVGGGGLGKRRSSVSADLNGSTGKSWVARRAPSAYSYRGPPPANSTSNISSWYYSDDAHQSRAKMRPPLPQTCCTLAALASTSTLSPPLPSGQTSWWIVVAIHHRKSAGTIVLSRKPSNACTLEHLCKIRVVMVLEVPRTLMQTAEFSIRSEGISTTITTITTMP